MHIPCGLVARIRRFHRRGRGSIPRKGELFADKYFFYPFAYRAFSKIHEIFDEKKEFPDFAATFRRSRNVAYSRRKVDSYAKLIAEYENRIH